MAEFHELYERYYQDLYRFAVFLTGDPTRAEDLVADTFVRAFVARDRINHATVRAYLLTIAKNLHRDHLRRRQLIDPIAADVPDPSPAVETRVHSKLALESVREGLHRVARGDRQAFVMFIAGGMSQREIARALGVTVGAVKSRIFRAREALLAAAGS